MRGRIAIAVVTSAADPIAPIMTVDDVQPFRVSISVGNGPVRFGAQRLLSPQLCSRGGAAISGDRSHPNQLSFGATSAARREGGIVIARRRLSSAGRHRSPATVPQYPCPDSAVCAVIIAAGRNHRERWGQRNGRGGAGVSSAMTGGILVGEGDVTSFQDAQQRLAALSG